MTHLSADMAELADAPDLGSGIFDVRVQVPLSAFFLFDYDYQHYIFYHLL